MELPRFNPRRATNQLFRGKYAALASAPEPYVWEKPSNARYFSFLIIGAGGGGGGGFTRAAANGGGGGGGGSGGIVRLQLPTIFVPPILYLNVPQGGLGGSGSGVAGGAGAITTIGTVQGSVVAATLLGASSAAAAGGGAAGATGTASATAGAAATVATRALAALCGLGTWLPTVGQIGGVGSPSTANGTAVTFGGTGIMISGGGGGGGASSANVARNGANITGVGLIPTIAGGTGANPGTPGAHGINMWPGATLGGVVIGSTGGAGGGAGGTGVGAAGGNGGFGSGGGGGGAGTTGAAGGNGGDGLIFVEWW